MAAKKKDINDVTDEISLIMREVVEATENNMLLEVASTLNKHADKVSSASEYRLKQIGENKELQAKLRRIAKQSEMQQINVAKNIGTYAGINTAPLEQEIKKGMAVVLQSAQDEKNKQVQKIYQLNKFNTSAKFIPDLKKSIIENTINGIEKGLPVTYKNGKKIGYREYMEMAVRTGIQQEIGQQQIEIGKQASIVFFLCDEYGDCADDHKDYQGKIYYNADYKNFNLTEDAKQLIANAIKAKQFLSVQEVRDGEPYLTTRPNCRHRLIPISIDEAIGSDLARVKQSVDSVRGNYRPENYDALQKQRYYERNIRKAKSNVEIFEKLKKDNPNEAEYQRQVERYRMLAAKYQAKQRDLLEANPNLSREYRRETRKVLIKDLGVKYNLKTLKGQPPTPVTNNPPPAPPISNGPAQAQLNQTVASHYAMPEEKKVYIKKAYEIDWQEPQKKVIDTNDKKTTYDFWKKDFENIDNEPETDEARKITAYFYKEMKSVLGDNFSILKLDDEDGYYKSSSHLIVTHKITATTPARKNITYTHEVGHAIDYQISRKFGLATITTAVSQIGTDASLLRIYYQLTNKSIRQGVPYYRITELTQEEREEILKTIQQNQNIDKKQFEMLKNGISFSQAIEKAQLAKEGGRVSKKELEKWEDDVVEKSNAMNEKNKLFNEGLEEKSKLEKEVGISEISDKRYNLYEKIQDLIKKEEKINNDIKKNVELYFDKKEITEEEFDKRREKISKQLDEINSQSKAYQDEYYKLKKEEDAIRDREKSKFEQLQKVYEKKLASKSQIEDFFDALSGGRSWETQRVITNGHGQTYFNTQMQRNVEIFTHLMTLKMHNPRFYEALKKDYPDIVAAHEKILADALPVFAETKGKPFHPDFVKKDIVI